MAANEEEQTEDPNDLEPITCPIGRWYFKRMSLLGALLLGFGCWFLYDAVIGYPKGAYKAVAFEAFGAGSEMTWDQYAEGQNTNYSKSDLDAEQLAAVKKAHAAGGSRIPWEDFAKAGAKDGNSVLKSLLRSTDSSEYKTLKDAFTAGGKVASADAVLSGWGAFAGLNGLPVDPIQAQDDKAIEFKAAFAKASQTRDWKLYAADNGLPSKEPHFHGKGDIIEQYVFGGLCAVAGLSVLGIMLLNRNRTITADATAYYPKPDVKVPFDDIFRIDTRKWRRKGLAYAFYNTPTGDENKASVDDLKFVGAQKILDRMLKIKPDAEVAEEFDDDGEPAEDAPEEGPESASESSDEVAGKEG